MIPAYVVAVSSEKGGVGKTTLATNLAIYLKALDENIPVTLFSFDNHFSVDRMFRIGRGKPKGNVLSMLQGQPPEEIVETGEYGVQFIPSSSDLSALRDQVRQSDLLAATLAASSLSGVVIIDTRPDLDIFTQNALYASDRVIVPVKDAPSLENCKNLYGYFDSRGLSRQPLRILPCLIDSRIRYNGPFKDPYQLLKGYAINRGYKCLEGYISKSPRVESLNTNPEGKIYPVITHGRNTEVHIQFTHIARQIYLGAKDKTDRRLAQVRTERGLLESERQEELNQRKNRLKGGCLICGRQLELEAQHLPVGYYAETSDGSVAGYIEEGCFSDMVFRHFYRSSKEISPTDSLRDLLRESAQRSYFALRRTLHTRNFHQQQISFYRFDEDGLELSHKTVDLEEFEGRVMGRKQTLLYRLALKSLFKDNGLLGDEFLLIRRVSSDFPDEILYPDQYDIFSSLGRKIASQFPDD